MEKEEMTFIDEMIREAEEHEDKQTEAFYDLLLLQIKNLNQQIEKNFTEAEKECNIINNWALMKNSQLNERLTFLELKLEAFIKERGEKTIDLPNGTLKYYKKPDKVEITDLELFLKNAKPTLVTVIPESVKPDLNKIKLHIKTHPTPPGVTVTTGKEEFTYKLKGVDNGREKEIGVGSKQTAIIGASV
jgi:Bacteriophage Mu Gam like protein